MAIARTALFLTALFQAVLASTNSSDEEKTHEDASRDEVFWLTLVLLSLWFTACVFPGMALAQYYEEYAVVYVSNEKVVDLEDKNTVVPVVPGVLVTDDNDLKKPSDSAQKACASLAASFRSAVGCPNSIAVRKPNETGSNTFAYFAAGSGACASESCRPSLFA